MCVDGYVHCKKEVGSLYEFKQIELIFFFAKKASLTPVIIHFKYFARVYLATIISGNNIRLRHDRLIRFTSFKVYNFFNEITHLLEREEFSYLSRMIKIFQFSSLEEVKRLYIFVHSLFFQRGFLIF